MLSQKENPPYIPLNMLSASEFKLRMDSNVNLRDYKISCFFAVSNFLVKFLLLCYEN